MFIVSQNKYLSMFQVAPIARCAEWNCDFARSQLIVIATSNDVFFDVRGCDECKQSKGDWLEPALKPTGLVPYLLIPQDLIYTRMKLGQRRADDGGDGVLGYTCSVHWSFLIFVVFSSIQDAWQDLIKLLWWIQLYSSSPTLTDLSAAFFLLSTNLFL